MTISQPKWQMGLQACALRALAHSMHVAAGAALQCTVQPLWL